MSTKEIPISERIAALETRWNNLQDDLALQGVQDRLEDIESSLATLPGAVEHVRSRGYAFRSYLERKIQVLKEQWGKTRLQVLTELKPKASQLRLEGTKLGTQFDQLRAKAKTPAAASLVTQVDSALNTLGAKVSAAESTLNGMYDELQSNIDQTKAQLAEITNTLDQCEQGCFQLLAGEDVVLAVTAQWDRDGKDDPKGVLFLTDSRLIFEQKEEVAKKKVLFITTEKEMVQEVLLEAALGDVEEIKATSKGLMGKDDYLEAKFGGKATHRAASLHIWFESKDWQQLFARVKSGDIAHERVKPKDQAVLDAVKAAPTKCSTCGAQITQQIPRGATQITCDYCGTVIRV